MNPVELVIGFVPFVLFTVLGNWIPVGWAAGVGGRRDHRDRGDRARRRQDPAGRTGDDPARHSGARLPRPAAVDAFLIMYGRGVASLLLGLFILVTATSMPFTAQFARAAVPPWSGTAPGSCG